MRTQRRTIIRGSVDVLLTIPALMVQVRSPLSFRYAYLP